MVHSAKMKHSALCIQCAYRGWKARLRAKRLRNQRKLRRWIYLRYIAKIRYRFAGRSSAVYIETGARSVLKSMVQRHRSAIKIQACYRMHSLYKQYTVARVTSKVSGSVLDHVLLFGVRRALYALSVSHRHFRALQVFLHFVRRRQRQKR
jgi:hypothetical protein